MPIDGFVMNWMVLEKILFIDSDLVNLSVQHNH